jgi:hypothetical protein
MSGLLFDCVTAYQLLWFVLMRMLHMQHAVLLSHGVVGAVVGFCRQ